MRTGSAWCAMRFRAYDEDDKVLTGVDLVPGLVTLLQQTFAPVDAGGSGSDGVSG